MHLLGSLHVLPLSVGFFPVIHVSTGFLKEETDHFIPAYNLTTEPNVREKQLEKQLFFSRLLDKLLCVNSLPGVSSLVSDLLPPRAGGPAEQDQGDAVG